MRAVAIAPCIYICIWLIAFIYTCTYSLRGIYCACVWRQFHSTNANDREPLVFSQHGTRICNRFNSLTVQQLAMVSFKPYILQYYSVSFFLDSTRTHKWPRVLVNVAVLVNINVAIDESNCNEILMYSS